MKQDEEDKGNIRTLCAEHAPKPIDYEGDPAVLIGRYVKLGFPTGSPPDGVASERWPVRENMWVKVTRTDRDTMTGTLDNKPSFVDMELGQEVQFIAAEIVDIFTEGSA